jgi:uncharacterized spore protein YtfJ
MARVGAVSIEELAAGIKDGMSVNRVFGEAIERDGVTVIPVASIGGGGGAGGGGTEAEGGSGGAFGLGAKPVGVYVIKNGQVSWQPAIDANRVISSAQIAIVLVLLTVRKVLKRRAKRR